MNGKGTRIATFVRLPLYRNHLRSLNPMPEHISAAAIAGALGFGEVQVRKDLALVFGGGRPRTGYVTKDLLAGLETVLERRGAGDAVLVGAGKIGRALMEFDGFTSYGIEIIAGFDNDPAVLGKTDSGKDILDLSKLPAFCKKHKVRVGVIAVPDDQAQAVCDMLVKAGVQAIWCFTAVRLNLPDNIVVRYENLAASLAAIFARLDGLTV